MVSANTEVLAGCFLDELPARLVGDKAYDSGSARYETGRGVRNRVDRAQPAAQAQNPRPGQGCAATEDGGRWRDSSPGSTTSAASSPDGNTTSRISWISHIWLAFTYCCATSDLRSPPSLHYYVVVALRLEKLIQITALGRCRHKLGMPSGRHLEIAVDISTLPKFDLQRLPIRRITNRSNTLRVHRFPPHLVRLERRAGL